MALLGEIQLLFNPDLITLITTTKGLVDWGQYQGWLHQCDQIAGLFFNIWRFPSMKICLKVYKICQSRFKILPNGKLTLEKLPKTLKILPKWRNFAKSGHIGAPSTYLQWEILQLFPPSCCFSSLQVGGRSCPPPAERQKFCFIFSSQQVGRSRLERERERERGDIFHQFVEF